MPRCYSPKIGNPVYYTLTGIYVKIIAELNINYKL